MNQAPDLTLAELALLTRRSHALTPDLARPANRWPGRARPAKKKG